MASSPSSRGAAIVSALLTVAIAAALAGTLASRVSRWLDQLRQEREVAQTREILRAALDWTCSVLEQDGRGSSHDHLGEAWAQASPIIPVDQDGEMRGQIQDASARFNLNNLVKDDGSVDEAWLAAYRRLLATLGLPAPLAPALADWLDRNQEAPGGGPEFSGESVRPAHRPLVQVGEIAAIPGYDTATVARLLPFVTALPERTTVNVNTAGAPVLAALAEQGQAGMASLLAERERQPFRDRADFQGRMAKAGVVMDSALVDVSSRWFLVSGRVRYRDSTRPMEALLQRNALRTRMVWWSDR